MDGGERLFRQRGGQEQQGQQSGRQISSIHSFRVV